MKVNADGERTWQPINDHQTKKRLCEQELFYWFHVYFKVRKERTNLKGRSRERHAGKFQWWVETDNMGPCKLVPAQTDEVNARNQWFWGMYTPDSLRYLHWIWWQQSLYLQTATLSLAAEGQVVLWGEWKVFAVLREQRERGTSTINRADTLGSCYHRQDWRRTQNAMCQELTTTTSPFCLFSPIHYFPPVNINIYKDNTYR